MSAQTILVFGGAGFIGARVVRRLAGAGCRVICVKHRRAAEVAGESGRLLSWRNGDIACLDDVLDAMREVQPQRVLNLAYALGSDNAPHEALRLNVLGMDNVLEAARLCQVPRVVYASSIAVYGRQSAFGDRAVSETDPLHGEQQYAMHKRFNEWQAQDYREKHGMSVIGIRPANGTGVGKARGSVDHVQCVVASALGSATILPYRDSMRAVVHVDDIAEVFVSVLLAASPRFDLYNTGGSSVSLGELAGIVRGFLPGASMEFEREHGGRALSGCHLIDNRRMVDEFGIRFPPLRQRVLEMINEVRRQRALSPILPS